MSLRIDVMPGPTQPAARAAGERTDTGQPRTAAPGREPAVRPDARPGADQQAAAAAERLRDDDLALEQARAVAATLHGSSTVATIVHGRASSHRAVDLLA